jgi:flavin-binding protein dodecin
MAIHKVIEIMAQSPKGWDDATQQAVAEAGKTVKNMHSLYLKEMVAEIKDGKIINYRINAKLTFEVERAGQR